MAVAAICCGAGTAAADTGLVDLRARTLSAEQISGLVGPAEVGREGPFDAVAALTGISDKERLDNGVDDRLLSQITRSVRQGYEREFETADGSELIRIRLVEMVNHSWAESLSHAEHPQGPPTFPPDTFVGHQDGEHRGTELGVRNSVGRTLIAITVRTRMDDRAPQVDPALYQRLSRQAGPVLAAQMKALPQTPDVATGKAFDRSSDRTMLGVVLVVGIALLALGYTASASIRDSATRERFRRQRRATSDSAEVVDLTGSVRGARFRNLMANLIKLAALCCWAWYCYFETPGLRLIPMMVLFVGGICLSATLEIWWRSRRDRSGTHSLRLLPTAVGIGGAASILGVGGLLIVAAVTGFALYIGTYFWIPALALMLAAIRAMRLTAKPIRLAKRLAAPSVAEALEHDDRAEVMLLRSFQDDDLEMRMHASARHTALEFVSTEPYERFEELIAWTLWRFGPVLAIGQPGTVLQPLGAAREYHDDDSWQQAVRDHIRRSAVVAFVVGRSPGLLWEARTVCELQALGKAVFIFPPEDPDEINSRIDVLSAALNLNPDCIPRQSSRVRPMIAMYFSDDGVPVVLTAQGRDDIAYSRATDYAAIHVTAPGRPELRRPRHDLLLPEQIVDDLLTTFDPTYRRPPRKKAVKKAMDIAMNFIE